MEGPGYAVPQARHNVGLMEIVQRRADVVLLDLGLPDMEGVIKVLRRTPRVELRVQC